MKVLLLSLLLGLVCDAQEADDQKGLSQLSGKWITVFIASTIPEKIAENGPFRAYLCYLVFDDEQGTVDFYFYVKLNGEWVAKHVTGKKTKHNTYVVEYEGENKFEVIYASDTVLVVSVVNKDKNKRCGEIQLAAIFVKVNDIEEKALEIFKELLKLKGIEEKYIVNFFKSGDCPPCAKLWSSVKAQ
nr:odorant-binding protein-like [Bubalus bubalis]